MRVPRTDLILIAVAAVCLGGCSTQPKLEVVSTDTFSLYVGSATEQMSVVVTDHRPEEQKIPARFGGWLQLGDSSLSPVPELALGKSLQDHISSRGTSVGVRRAITHNSVGLRHFQVLMVNREIESGFVGIEHQAVPAVLALDALVTSLLRSTIGSSRVRVVIAFDIGEIRFSSDEFLNFPAAPGSEAPARVLEKALQPIFRRLEIAFGAK